MGRCRTQVRSSHPPPARPCPQSLPLPSGPACGSAAESRAGWSPMPATAAASSPADCAAWSARPATWRQQARRPVRGGDTPGSRGMAVSQRSASQAGGCGPAATDPPLHTQRPLLHQLGQQAGQGGSNGGGGKDLVQEAKLHFVAEHAQHCRDLRAPQRQASVCEPGPPLITHTLTTAAVLRRVPSANAAPGE